jgi:two-component system, OmpR family, sensor kinase
MSLRQRVIVGVLVLAAVALVGADVATYISLRSFLLQRTDSSLQTDHTAVENALRTAPSGTGPCEAAQRAVPSVFVQLRTRTSGRAVCSAPVVDFSKLPPPTTTRGRAPGPRSEPPTKPPPRLPAVISLPQVSQSESEPVRYFGAAATKGGAHYRVRASLDPELRYMLVVARPLDDVYGTLHRLLLIELLVMAVGLSAIALLGLWVVRLGLRPLDAIEKTAAAIAAGDLSRRVERAEKRTEVGRLGMALNAMLGHIEAAFGARAASEQKLRRFVADASHELRTPLAAIRAYAELFDRGSNARPEDLARSMTGITRESERMSLLVEDLLLLARLDEGRPLEREPLELDKVVGEAVDTALTVDPDRPIELAAERTLVLGDRDRLRQIVDNLLSKVRAHTPDGTPVQVTVASRNGHASVEVADSGPGMASADLDRVFERFYRADASRSRTSGGVGLGLSIVAAVAEAHGGTASARSEPGEGTTFRITLPLLDRPA